MTALSASTRRHLAAGLCNAKAADEIADVLEVANVLSSTEAGYLDSVTAGTATASKAVVLDSSKGISTITSATITTITTGAFSARAGGLLYANVADSTAYASTSAETFFDTIATIPASSLIAGSVIKAKFMGVATTTVANDTLAFKLYIAANTTTGSISGNAVITAAATDATNADTFTGEAVITIRTIGNSGTAVAMGTYKVSSAEGTMTVKDDMTASFTINTNIAQYVGVAAAWSHTSNANSCLLRQMVVEVY